jgi:hypothetical protein
VELAADVAAIRSAVDEIRTVVVRPMSESEAAGEAELTMDKVSLALEDVDMDDLPAAGATEQELEQWMAGYLDRATLEEVLDLGTIAAEDERRRGHEHDSHQHAHELP